MIERFDNSKEYIYSRIIHNSRLEDYKTYITLARDYGYRVCSMHEFWNDKDSAKKHFILRHDVDHKGLSTRKMFESELELGVRSTYYFRKCTEDEPLIFDMLKEGFDVGFHYETIADYCIEKRISRFSSDQEKMEIILKCRDRLKQDISVFKNKYGIEVCSVSSHGAPQNETLGISNNVLLENEKYREFGVEFEAYDRDLYDKYIDYHIMDGSIRINYGFAYNRNPIDGINAESRNIVFLSHPFNWWYTGIRQASNLTKMLFGNCSFSSDREFVRINI